MKRTSFYFTTLLLFFVSGCGVGSIYNPSYYSETALGEELFRVTFQGGSAPLTGDLCLLRCAEVTLESKKKLFSGRRFRVGQYNQKFSFSLSISSTSNS